MAAKCWTLSPSAPQLLKLLVLSAQLFSAQSNVSNMLNPTKVQNYGSKGLHLKEDAALDTLKGRIGAFGDFDSDMYTDLYWISDSNGDIEVLRWGHGQNSFEMPPITSAVLPDEAKNKVLNLAPGDFNRDGKLDLLVSAHDKDTDHVTLLVYFGNNKQLSAKPLRLPSGTKVHPLVLEANGDLKPDLFGEGGTSSLPVRSFWINQLQEVPAHCFNGALDEEEKGEDCGGPCYDCACFEEGEQVDKCGFVVQEVEGMEGSHPLSTSRAQAFADIDGDCLSDLIISYNDDSVEVWLNGGSSELKPNFNPPPSDGRLKLRLPAEAGSVVPTDINRDGSLDLLYVVAEGCRSSNPEPEMRSLDLKDIDSISDMVSPCSSSKIYVALNSANSTSGLCQGNPGGTMLGVRQAELFVAEEVMGPETFGNDLSFFGPGERLTTTNGDLHLLHDMAIDPLFPHTGDYDLDGFVDLLLPVRRKADGSYRLMLLRNVEDKRDGKPDGARTFARSDLSAMEELEDTPSIYSGAFFDLSERGNLDVLVLYEQQGILKAKAFNSNLNGDNLFFKTTGLNGVCVEWCSGPIKFPNPKPYGVNAPGVTFQYKMQDVTGARLTSKAAQLGMSTHSALNLPFTVFGLGTASYYIEEFYMGVPKSTDSAHYYSWFGAIPNSQMVVSPTGNDPEFWYLNAFVHPSEGVIHVSIVLGVALAVLGASILCLEQREKYQDQMEKQLTAHAFL